MNEMLEVTSDNFISEVLEEKTPVLVDFGAVWCAPCKRLDPIVIELAGEWGDKVKVVHVDVDNNPDIAMDHGVMGVPTLILFKEGEVVERVTGFKPKKKLADTFGKHL
jgi:thioredoxin 1